MLPLPYYLRVVAFLLSGAVGTFLLLPHSHGLVRPLVAHRIGYALVGISALVFASFFKAPMSYLTGAFFYIFGFTSILGAVLTITSRNPIHSALWFASVVLSTSGLFLLAGAQFLAAGTVIVYAGAIIVTFLFVIMLAQMEGRAIYDRSARSPFWATFSTYLLLFGLICALLTFKNPRTGQTFGTLQAQVFPVGVFATNPGLTSELQAKVIRRAVPAESLLPNLPGRKTANDHVAGLGAVLYTQYLVAVELAGALLFVALVGALAIASPKPPVRPMSADAAPNA